MARQCADSVAAAEAERDRYGRNVDAARRHIVTLRAGIAKADARIGEIRREFLAARSRAALQRATGALQSSKGVSSALAAAEETLARITELQTDAADRATAADLLADEKSGKSLRQKLSEAGIAEPAPHTADAVLARSRAASRAAIIRCHLSELKETIMHSNSPAWTLYCYVSFIVALAMMTVGISMIPGEPWTMPTSRCRPSS